MKIRKLKQILRRRGYQVRAGRGSHSIWTHPDRPDRPIVLHRSANGDAHHYQIARVFKSKRARQVRR